MHPIAYILSWTDPATGFENEAQYHQRGRARGMAVILRAKGMLDVKVTPKFQS